MLDLAKQLHRIVRSLLINKLQLTPRVGGREPALKVGNWLWILFKSTFPGPADAPASARHAPRSPLAGQWVRTVEPLSLTDTGA
jgi:hypothetical protein